jgi:hypothetical protein
MKDTWSLKQHINQYIYSIFRIKWEIFIVEPIRMNYINMRVEGKERAGKSREEPSSKL